MEKMNYSFSAKIFWLIMAAVILVPACSETENDNPPVLPPASSMVIDFSDFQQSSKSEQSSWYWLNAALNVAVWNTVITVGLAVPVAAFWESFKHEGVYQGNKEWVWSYNVTALGAVYKADLHGIILDNNKVRWEMYVTKTGDFSDFLWYYGEVSTDRTEGYWIMNEKPENQLELLRIDWTREAGADIADIKYTNIQPGGAENGGYVQYGIPDDQAYDRFYDIYNKGQDKLINILYNTETKQGRIRDPKAYGDQDWRCWDSDLQDTECN